MTDARVDILDLCDALGGMKKTVEFLISMDGYVTIINSWGHEQKDPKIQYRNNGMVDGITFGNSSYSYGYLKRNPNKIKIIFRGADPDLFMDLSTMKEKLDKRKEDLRLKHIEDDPYDEEEWLEESNLFEYNRDDYEYVSPMGLFRRSIVQNRSDYYKFEYYMKKELVGHEIEFKGMMVKNFDCHPSTEGNLNLMTFRITVKDVHITKDGLSSSAIYLLDELNYYYFATCDDIKIIDEDYKNKKKKEREDLRLKHIKYDPYSEENWLEEKITRHMKDFNEFVNETYFHDLTPFEYGVKAGAYKNAVNIGWLDKGEDYTQGEVPKGFLKKLRDVDALAHHKGGHRCPFCGGGYSSEVHYVQGNGIKYVFPQMLSHYISDHGYKPPQEFIDVVMNLPDKEKERDRRMYKGSKLKGKSLDDSDYTMGLWM